MPSTARSLLFFHDLEAKHFPTGVDARFLPQGLKPLPIELTHSEAAEAKIQPSKHATFEVPAIKQDANVNPGDAPARDTQSPKRRSASQAPSPELELTHSPKLKPELSPKHIPTFFPSSLPQPDLLDLDGDTHPVVADHGQGGSPDPPFARGVGAEGHAQGVSRGSFDMRSIPSLNLDLIPGRPSTPASSMTSSGPSDGQDSAAVSRAAQQRWSKLRTFTLALRVFRPPDGQEPGSERGAPEAAPTAALDDDPNASGEESEGEGEGGSFDGSLRPPAAVLAGAATAGEAVLAVERWHALQRSSATAQATAPTVDPSKLQKLQKDVKSTPTSDSESSNCLCFT